MTKAQFLKLMQFPIEWTSFEMYPDELFQWQLATYEPGHEAGSEHDRNGAFHWWLRRTPNRDQLQKLLRLAALDPDPLLGTDLRNYIRKAAAYDDRIARLELELFGSRKS
jgi:hypothetical protein